MLERKTLCLASQAPGFTYHYGDDNFRPSLAQHYATPESDAAERLVNLKLEVEALPDDCFWQVMLEGISDLLNAQYVFVAKRIVNDDPSLVVEMPAIGEPGSCFMAVGMVVSPAGQPKEYTKDFKYLAYGSPCANMKHAKVFLVPSSLGEYIPDRIDDFALPLDNYMGVPLFHQGKCFAHFGCMWSPGAFGQTGLSWGFVEMAFHALEDMIKSKILQGESLASTATGRQKAPQMVIPKRAVAVTQSLKPYARSLSHELRTPMQGIVGLLDIMHATIQDGLENTPSEETAQMFASLRENIELIQDSSRRAVEAADNVVQAYDLDMQIPNRHQPLNMTEDHATIKRSTDLAMHEPFQVSPARKRKLSETSFDDGSYPSPHRRDQRTLLRSPQQRELNIEEESPQRPSTPSNRPLKVRDLVRLIINEAVRFEGRPDSAVASATDLGEVIEVRKRGSNGEASTQTVEWGVDAAVPEDILFDEKDFSKLISVLLSNALKFTPHGMVKLHVAPSPKGRYLVINVLDTGQGIPTAFQPRLFKPFSREDDSLTRHSEGLGLGLMVAKGIARRHGGELILVRSATYDQRHGSEFELRIPTSPLERTSRHGTPSRTPTPFQRERSSTPNGWASEGPKSLGLALHSPAPHASARSGPVNVPRRASHRDPDPSPVRPLSAIKFDKRLSQRYPQKFLVVEDNRINRKLLVNMLSKLGYSDVQEAFDGAEAVRLMEMDGRALGKRPIDMILMDLWMPNMDGYEAAERILAMKNGLERQLKILAVSADTTEDALDRARAVGMAGTLAKPFKLIDLERLITEHCEPVAA